ncbi:MAG: response regulator transcription factor [Oscillospiraceae bacterium]|nr:response regulator transcription factor [Oscillospiraceae bacterium]
MPGTVLIVDDERSIVEILDFNLKKEGYQTLRAYDGAEGLRLAREGSPDVILLDVMLPKMDGFAVCAALRKEGRNMPIIMLTAREEERDKVFGLETGADDYITKPFSMRELLARVKTNLRRSLQSAAAENAAAAEANKITVRGLTLDLDRHSASLDGRTLDLTQREYELLRHLAQTPGKIVSRQELMQQVWQYDYYGDLRAVDVAVRRLREKLEKNPAAPEYVMTKRGVGYYLAE